MSEQNVIIVAAFFKGSTINKKIRLDYNSLKRPETAS
jgi:hypothetical protein